MTGHFFVIDGPDGAGKGTQIRMLKDTLLHRYGRPPEDFVFTREPGGSPFAEEIRKLILSPRARDASASVMVQLFGAARFDHLEQTIVPALAKGKVVISDRFASATYAYQVVAQDGGKATWDLLETQNTLIKNFDGFSTKRCTTIILEVSAEIGMNRSAVRKGQTRTHFDARDIAFQQAVHKGFGVCNNPFGHTVWVDGSRTPALVHHDIIEIFDRVLGGPSPLS